MATDAPAPTDAGGGGGTTSKDPRGLATLPAEKICTLLTNAEAKGILGGDISDGFGISAEGLGTNCLWDLKDLSAGIKVEFNVLSFKDQRDIGAFTGTIKEIQVGGQPAVVITPKTAPSKPTVTVLVQLGTVDQIGMYVEGPTLEGATKVAELAYSRLDTLK